MDNTSISRTIAGLGVILVGLAALLGSLNIINFGNLFANYWPTAVIAGGLLILLAKPREHYTWAALFIALGILWQLRVLDVIDFNVWSLFWPLVLIALGWSIVMNRAGATIGIISKDTNNVSAILGGVTTKADSQDYTGGRMTAILGGSSLDLRKATVKKEATIEVFALMGGVEIKVPEGWRVQSSVVPVLGGVENKSAPVEGKTAPILNIVGTVILGGVEIKY